MYLLFLTYQMKLLCATVKKCPLTRYFFPALIGEDLLSSECGCGTAKTDFYHSKYYYIDSLCRGIRRIVASCRGTGEHLFYFFCYFAGNRGSVNGLASGVSGAAG